MPNLIGYNPYSDVGGAIQGGGDILGGTILRGALMRQAQAHQQQQLMIELMRMKMEQEQNQSLNRYRDTETELGKGRLDIEKRKQGAADEELGMRKKFGASMRMQRVGPLPEDYGAPTMEGTRKYEGQKQQADQQEGAAFLSNEPKNALDTILRMQAVRSLGGVENNPAIAEQLAAGFGLHNVPPGNTAIAPGGAVAGQGIPQRPVGRTAPPMLNPGVIPPLLEKLLDKFPNEATASQDPTYKLYKAAFDMALRERFGTNLPAMTQPQGTNTPKIVIQDGNKFQINADGSHVFIGPAN